jgi:hypothetical protein
VDFCKTKSKIRKRIELRSNREYHWKKIKSWTNQYFATVRTVLNKY